MNTRNIRKHMNRFLILLPLLLIALPGWGQTANVYRFGRYAANMKPDVLTAVLNAATEQGRKPWALFPEWGRVMIEPHTQAFYAPHRATAQLRRGIVRTFRCTSTALPSECLDWEPVGKPRNYVQVAEKGTFATSLRPRSTGERPVMLTGTFSDTDVLSLVEYVRSGRSVLPAFAMCGDDPIWKIERSRRGAVSVIFSNDNVGGCSAKMRQAGRQWEVADCGCWVS